MHLFIMTGSREATLFERMGGGPRLLGSPLEYRGLAATAPARLAPSRDSL
jgi:hypothetical protein